MHKQEERESPDLKSVIANNHDYLNFVKKNTRLGQYQSNQIGSPQQMTKMSSVFILKDKKQEVKLDKLAYSLSKPSYQVKTKMIPQDTQYQKAQMVNHIVEKKNKEIEQLMSKEKQSMSQIVYNYSKFRSMESHMNRGEKSKKKSEKSSQPKDSFRFPNLHKNPQDIFTLDYDSDGKKLVKVDLKKFDETRQKDNGDILTKQKSLSRDLKAMFTDKEFTKRSQLHLFKRKKYNNDFGIEIKSINNKIIENEAQRDISPLRLRKQLYQIVPDSNPRKRDQLKQLREQSDKLLSKLENTKNQQCKEPKYHSVEFKFISSKEIFTPNFYDGYTSQYSFKSLKQTELETKSLVQLQEKEQEEKQKDKERQNESSIKREITRKNMVALYEKQYTVYDQKINSYRQFIFMLNLAHKKIDPLTFGDSGTLKTEDKFKYYIGGGNNSLLVKSLMKRRFWWVQEDDYKKANFAWTQLKISNFFQQQRKSERFDIDSKIEGNFEDLKKKKNLKKDTEIKSPMRGNIFFKAPLPPDKDKILTISDKKILDILQNNVSFTDFSDKIQKYCNRLKYWQGNPFSKAQDERKCQHMHNHLEFNHYIGNKKALYYNLKRYYELRSKNVFEVIPLTFHIRSGVADAEFTKFAKEFKRLQTLKHKQKSRKEDPENAKQKIKNIWIVKPGENSNRGNGIEVINELYSFVTILKKQEKHPNGDPKTYIVQKYIQKPLLYKGRKFDIRHYMMITRLHGQMRAYWYGEGYIRTSSYCFDLDDVGDETIHLTNDAIQKNCTFYGKHEEGNKLSYLEFQKYLDQTYPEEKINFAEQIYPKMKNIATDAIKSTYLMLDSNNLEHNFQIFGLDFMIDENFDVWLIEVNTNPCLELSSKILGRIIPNMLEQALRLSIDIIFPPPTHYPNSQKYLAPDNTLGRLMYQLVFDEARDGKELVNLYKGTQNIDYGGQVKQDEDIYQNQGKQIELGTELS